LEIWEGEVLLRRGGPEPTTNRGYFGDHPWEYGEGYVDWVKERVEEITGIECPHCRAEELGEVLYKAEDFASVCASVLLDFRNINRELIEYFSQHPDRLHDLEPRQFEELLEAVFLNQGYRTELGPGRDDRGVDLRLFRKDSIGEIVTLVQAKRYRHDLPIRLEAVQALSAAVDTERAHRGLFVTTSYFLPGAETWAKTMCRRIDLADAKDVARWCRNTIGRTA
jgi:hypothetical protein